MICQLLVLIGWAAFAQTSAADGFADVKIDKPFDRYLLASAPLMEAGGAKIVKLTDRKRLVLSVASTALNDNSPQERLRAERVCRTKALAYIVGETRGVQVYHTEESVDKTVTVIEDGKEKGKSVSTFLEITKTKVQGIAKDLPVVGLWKSKDEQTFYLAIGGICDENGDLVQQP